MSGDSQYLSNLSKDSIIQQLDDFDFSTPVKVNVIFDDDEDQNVALVDIKGQKTENNENYTDTPVEKEKNVIKTKNHSVSNIKAQNMEKVESQSNFTVQYIQTNSSIVPADAKKAELCNSNEKIFSNNMNLKRKSHLESDSEPKMCKVNNVIHYTPKNTFQGEYNYAMYQNSCELQDKSPNAINDKMNADNCNTEMTCITNLLKNVSQHLILVIEAYNKYAPLRANKAISSTERERHRTHFLRIKQHFFNLSFYTVDNIILPQENNILFTGQFLNDTVKLATSKNKPICLETQVAPVFFELLQWCKQKKLYMSNMAIGSGNIAGQVHPLLKQQLEKPAGQSPQSSSVTVPDEINKFVINYNSVYTGTYSTQINHNNVQNSSTSPSKNIQSKNNAHDPNKTATAVKSLVPPKNNNENQNSVLFITEPPEKIMSITLEQSVLGAHGTNNTTKPIVTSPTTEMRNSRMNRENTLPQIQSYEQSYQQRQQNLMTSYGQSCQDQQILIPNHEQLCHQSHQNSILSYEQTYQGQQNLIPSYEQAFQGRQNLIPANQFYAQQSQQGTQQDFSNISYTQNRAPPSYENAIAKAPPPRKIPIKHDYRCVEMHRIVQAQTQQLQIQNEQQNPEYTRSLSTDSGFMSPLNFNSSSEPNKDGVEDSQLPSPMITHITSLHPKASYIQEGMCYVCGKPTRQMCVGCYKRYYCSHPCQRFDWNIHKTMCNTIPFS